MTTTLPRGFWRPSPRATRAVIGALLVVIAAESFLLYQQWRAHRATEIESAKLLTTFLRGDTLRVPDSTGVSIRLQNVRFKWSDRVHVDAGNMALRAVPLHGDVVDFDNLDSFVLALQQSDVLIGADVLEGMLNESVFNYPGSKLRDLHVTLAREDVNYAVKISGRVNLMLWVPFSMVAFLDVDDSTNTLVMNVNRIKVFGFIPATPILRRTPLHLDRLVSMPPNNSLMVDQNRIMVKPFGLFPPPRITGRLAGVEIDEAGIHLRFKGRPIPAPHSAARNYVYLRGGTSQFGNFTMMKTDVLILDRNPSTPFAFSLQHYADMIPRSAIDIHDTRSVKVTMPDS